MACGGGGLGAGHGTYGKGTVLQVHRDPGLDSGRHAGLLCVSCV